MASPDDQRTGNGENYLWMQPANGLLDPENDIPGFTGPYMMQAGNNLWNLKKNSNYNDIFTDVFTVPAAVGGNVTSQISSNHINNLVANGSDYMPRGGAFMEQMASLFPAPFPVADSNTEAQHPRGNTTIARNSQKEPEYVTHAKAPRAIGHTRKNSGPRPEEWEKRMPEIYSLYVDNNYTLEVTRAEMAKKGFHAEASMYKRRIKGWGWRTYDYDKERENSRGESHIGKPGKRTRGRVSGPPSTLYEEDSQSNSSLGITMAASTPPHLAHIHSQSKSKHYSNKQSNSSHYYPTKFTSVHFNPSMLREETFQSNSSRSTTVAALAPPHLVHTHFNPVHFNMGIPTPMRKPDFDGLMSNLLAKVEDLYISYPAQKKWKVEKVRAVEEDIHDDLLVGVATSLRNYGSLSHEIGKTGFQKALHTLEKVIGVGEGADCGLFSLPAIWVSFVRMIRGQRLDWARDFLSQALKLAVRKFGREHSFVQVLLSLVEVWKKEPGQLEEVVFKAYCKCIERVKKQLGAFNLTYLTLWGDYVVYLDGTSTNETHTVVNDIRSVIKISEEKNGPDGGPDSDYHIELLGLTLYVLQSAPTMVDEAEKVAKELLLRIDQKRVKAGGNLEGDLFITWKDLRQTLGTFCLEKKDYRRAISYLEDFLNYEIVDDRDTLALEKLERCYQSLGRDDDAKKLRQWRMGKSQELLQKINMEPIEGENVVKDHDGKRDDNNGGNLSEGEGSSEETIENRVEEEGNEEDLEEEDDTDENGDREAEIQLVQDQIAELKRRLNVLKRARRRRGAVRNSR